MIALRRASPAIFLAAAVGATVMRAHSGPPFPIVTDRLSGPYQVSIWVDPDATDDGTAGGQFWVTLRAADGSAVPADTSALVTIRPLDRPGPERSGRTSPVDGNVARQFVAVLMDHEGAFAVRAAISGARGDAVVESTVEATYDLRPPAAMLVLYVMPFVAVGVLWLNLLRRRGAHRRNTDRRTQTEGREEGRTGNSLS